MDIQPIMLSGQTVRLEPLMVNHADDLALVGTPDIFIYTFPPPEFSPAGFRAAIEWLLSRPHMVPFAQVDQQTGRAIGVTTYLDIQPHNRSCEIGFTWIAKAYQGTKVNPESKYLLLRHAFEDQQAVRVQLKTDERNAHSRRAIEKLGAKYEGILRKHMILPNGYVRNTVMYSITDDEWPAVKQRLEARLDYRPQIG